MSSESIIPSGLLEAVREGRAVLFLGAGASVGATDAKGNEIPIGSGLGAEIDREFLGSQFKNEDFKTIYDYACSERDVVTIQRFIRDYLLPFHPASFHKIIPSFPWAGIVTTNYDLIIERSYDARENRSPKKLTVWTRDPATNNQQIVGDSTILNKIHGCITDADITKPPMVGSTEQLINFREGREGQVSTFLEWAKTKTIIFVGYKFNDANLRTAFQEIIKEGDNRPRHYFIVPGVLQTVVDYWKERRVQVISATFKEFIDELDRIIPGTQRMLGATINRGNGTAFNRFISVAGRTESRSLVGYISTDIDIVTRELTPKASNPAQFYQGFNQGWAPIADDLDVKRPIVRELLTDIIVPGNPRRGSRLVALKGHAGSGKTIALRRAAWEAGRTHDRLVFFVSREGRIDNAAFAEIAELTNVEVFVFVDNASEHVDDIVGLIRLFDKTSRQITVVVSENYNTWNAACEDLDRYVDQTFEMRYLSESEISSLLQKLEAHGSLGHLAKLDDVSRKSALKEVYGRQMIVALLEATSGRPLVDILLSEFDSIYPTEAKMIYLDICALHRFGPPVRAGLISRLHDISFEDFSRLFFKPLDHIVRLRKDHRSGDTVYEARHHFIANVVYENKFLSKEARFENASRILTKLNPAFSYDGEVLSKIIRAENVESITSDQIRARQLFDIARENFGERVVILHQRAVYELHQSSNNRMLDAATGYLNQALSLDPYNRSLKHTLAEIDLKRSRLSTNSVERIAYRAAAIEKASNLTHSATSPYPFHTIIKAKIDRVRDALDFNDGSAQQIEELGAAINEAEGTVRKALQRFPNEPMLLGQEGELAQILKNQTKAEAAFLKAFNENKRSTIAAKRVVSLLISRGALEDAEKIIHQALDMNPGSADLHFMLATVIREQKPENDFVRSDDIAYHLRRSFSPQDRNYEAKFWYARQLLLSEKTEEAGQIYESLAAARIPLEERQKVMGIVMDASGQPKKFSGTVVADKEGFCIIANRSPAIRVFYKKNESQRYPPGTELEYGMGFNLRGACAVQPRKR